MGQAFSVVNLDKKQYLRPHAFGDGYKLLELDTCLAALAVLLSNDGDHPWNDAPGHGAWCGDRIAVVGEYSDMVLDEYEEAGAELAAYLRHNDR